VPARPALKVTQPAELIHAIPYLLGFHPHDSVVLVGITGGDLRVTARLDTADVARTSVLGSTLDAFVRGGVDRVIAVLYLPEHPAGHADAAGGGAALDPLARLAAAVDAVGVRLDDFLVVSDGRWCSALCRESGCCPPGGTVLATCSSVAAEATYAGLVALPDRHSLEHLLDPAPVRERLRPALHLHEQQAADPVRNGDRYDRSLVRALCRAAREAERRAGGVDGGVDGEAPGASRPAALTDEQVARFGVALRRTPVRDAVWIAGEEGRIDGRMLWRDLAFRLPTPYDAAPLFLFGWATWREGDGALASVAARRALESDPDYSAADLLDAALAHGLDPRRMPRLRKRS
jgi:hypothetical protein